MIVRSLAHRIVMVFVGLFALVVAVLFVLVARTSERIVADQIDNDLAAGALLFSRLVEQNRNQLATVAAVLAADPALRAAAVGGRNGRILAIVREHARRVEADLVLVLDSAGRVMSDSRGEPGAAGDPRSDFPAATGSGDLAGEFQLLKDGRFFQIVRAPIGGPEPIGTVVLGSAVDDAWIRDLAGMTGLDVSLVRGDGSGTSVINSSFDDTERSLLVHALQRGRHGAPGALQVGAAHYQTVQRPLGANGTIMLLRSVEQAKAPFEDLQNALWALVIAGAAAFVAGSVLLARQIVRPVRELAGAARRIEAGDYRATVPQHASGEIGQLATSFDNMRVQVANREQKILKLAFEDSLTGLSNRTRFLAEFERMPPASRGAVLLVNLDRFAPINNALGHRVGDRLLAEIGQRLNRFAAAADPVARLWGDEFVLLLRAAVAGDAERLAREVAAAVREPVVLDGQRLDVDATIGIALFPDDGRDAATLLRRVELALSTAKRRHVGFVFASEADLEPPPEQLSLIGEMREARSRQEFVLYYQPKLDLGRGRVTGVEALIRWQHPVRGLIPPASFIPFAEQTGYIRELTPWVLDTAVQQAVQWREQGIELVPAVNISALDLLNPQLIDRLRALVSTYGLGRRAVCLEITESALVSDPPQALKHLHEMAALGFKLAIDDYGVGQASLAYLRTLPVHELKIDASFVREVGRTPASAAIVSSTIAMCHALGLTVVAEGAETAEDLAWLATNDCDQAQGYGIARPMPSPELAGWLAGRNGGGREAVIPLSRRH